MIYDIKGDPILQVPSQEPSTSSNSLKEARDSCQKHNCTGKLKSSSKSPIRNYQYSRKSLMEARDSLQSYNCAKKFKLGIQADNHILRLSMKSKMTPSSQVPSQEPSIHPSPAWRTG